jgi:mannose-1-phosphate guanylyltransferase
MSSKTLSFGTLKPTAEFVTVIMAGGSGTRFWPMSRAESPKQFLELSPDGKSLIRATADRLGGLLERGDLLVVTADNQVDLVREHLPNAKILAEPSARNTSACIGYAAAKVLAEVGDVPMLCLAADHIITGVAELKRTFDRAITLTKQSDILVPIGIPPAYPETGYGYIRRGEPFSGSEHAYHVHSFVEKPDLEKAMEYFASGEYFWNACMFVWRSGVIWKAFEEHLPGMYNGLVELKKLASRDFPVVETSSIYDGLESISIDYGVMERAKNVVMLAGVGFRWSDVGSWSAWKDILDEAHPSAKKNVATGDTIQVNCEDTLLIGEKKLVAGVGLKGIIVVETDDAILVCTRESAQEVRKVVDILKERNRKELL